MFKSNSRADDLTQGLAGEALPSFEQTSFDKNTTYLELDSAFVVPLMPDGHLITDISSMGAFSEPLLPDYNVADSLLSNSRMWYEPFLTQIPSEVPMLNSENGSLLDCGNGTSNFVETNSKDYYVPYNEEILRPNSEFEDLHMASLPSAYAFGSTDRIGPPSTNHFSESHFHGIPVIIASMRGGHRCLASDISKCAFTKYKFLLQNDDQSGESTSTSVSMSQPIQSLPLSPQVPDGGAVKLEERMVKVPPREPREAITISSVTHSSYGAPSGSSKTSGSTKGKKPKKGNVKTVCSVCRSTFSSLYNWTIHILKKRCQRSHDKKNESILCSGCGKKFKLKQYLYCHIKLKRCLGKPFQK